MRKFKAWLFLLFLLGFLLLASETRALKKRVRKSRGSGADASYTPRGVTSQVRLRGDRQALLINFSGFSNVQEIRYELVYEANGVTQGVAGNILAGDTDTKTLLFGTCSAGICTYHQNITNMRLSIISVLNSGVTVLKPYRVRV